MNVKGITLLFRLAKNDLLNKVSEIPITALLFTLLYQRVFCYSKILTSFFMVSSLLPTQSYLLLSMPNIEYSSKNPVGTSVLSIRSTLSRHLSLVIFPVSITCNVFWARQRIVTNTEINKHKIFFISCQF